MSQLATVNDPAMPAKTDAAAIVQVIERAAMNPDVDMDKMERLLAMQERIMAKNAEMAFNAAMADAQSKTRQVAADATNPQTRSKYASYSALDKALRPIYTAAGFSLSFDTGEGAPADWVRVLCYVSHRDGHSRTYHADMPADGKGAKGGDVMTKTHAAGSALSYGMRYLLKMIFNVAVGEDDDDGQAAGRGQTISESQVADLEALIEEVSADKAAFLRWAKVNSLSEIHVNAYAGCVQALRHKAKK